MERRNAWLSYTEAEEKELEQVAKAYRNFLNVGKTERECVTQIIREARAAGYESLEEKTAKGEKLKAGDKVYTVGMKKIIALFHIGQDDISEGMNILGAHIDSPRIDVKQNPLYENEGLAYLDTHYYGGVKKYQWLSIPLALHGVIVKKNGEKVEVCVGEKETDPVLVINDLLPHLGARQREKLAKDFIDGEQMDLLIGNRPEDKEENAVTRRIKNLLKERYDVEEEDFLSAELEIVPAGKARDCGLDNSMILAYGQDDRVCAFTSLFAILRAEEVARTSCCLLVDKEEIGSTGASGMTSRFFENAVAEYVLLNEGVEYNDIVLRRTLANSKMLSSDVSAGFDPMYEDVYEKRNAAFLARGPVFNKYTGSGGKSGSNDANPEYIAQLRQIMEEAGVNFQTAELGKVDLGGGGTIAYLMSVYGMEVIDSGVAVLGMHAPWETTSKADVYEAVRCYEAFLKAEF